MRVCPIFISNSIYSAFFIRVGGDGWSATALRSRCGGGGRNGVDKRRRGERDLREQLQNILRELEEIQQQPAGDAVVTPVQPAAVEEIVRIGRGSTDPAI